MDHRASEWKQNDNEISSKINFQRRMSFPICAYYNYSPKCLTEFLKKNSSCLNSFDYTKSNNYIHKDKILLNPNQNNCYDDLSYRNDQYYADTENNSFPIQSSTYNYENNYYNQSSTINESVRDFNGIINDNYNNINSNNYNNYHSPNSSNQKYSPVNNNSDLMMPQNYQQLFSQNIMCSFSVNQNILPNKDSTNQNIISNINQNQSSNSSSNSTINISSLINSSINNNSNTISNCFNFNLDNDSSPNSESYSQINDLINSNKSFYKQQNKAVYHGAINQKQNIYSPNNNFPKGASNIKIFEKRKNRRFTEREGDWICLKCKNLNFSFRTVCNRCAMPRASFDKTTENANSNEIIIREPKKSNNYYHSKTEYSNCNFINTKDSKKY